MSEDFKEESAKAAQGIAIAGAIMFISQFASKFLGILRDSIITGQFGLGDTNDAYRQAFMLPNILFFMISGGALSSAFIPIFSEYWHKDKKEEAWRLFSVVASNVIVILTVLMVGIWIFADPLYRHVLAQGQPNELYPLIVEMSRVLLPAQFSFFIGGMLLGTLYTQKVFAIPGLAPNIYNIGIIVGAVFISHFVEPGIKGACYGATIGAFIGNLVIPYYVARKRGLKFKFEINFKHEGAGKVFRLMLPVILGLSLPAVFDLISNSLASPYPGGTNAILTNSNQLMQAPLGLFGQSLGLAIFPVLTKFYADSRMDLFKDQVQKTLRTVIYLAIPTSVLMAVMADNIAAAFFLHGKATPDKVLEIATCLRIFCIGIWAWCMHPILMRAYYSIQNTITPIIIGTATTVVFYILARVLMLTSLGYKALPMAGSIAPMLMVGGMLYFLQSKIGGFEYKGLFVTLGKALVASIGVLVVCAAVVWTPLGTDLWRRGLVNLPIVCVVFTIAIMVFYKISKLLGMPESEYADRAIARMPWNRKKQLPPPAE